MKTATRKLLLGTLTLFLTVNLLQIYAQIEQPGVPRSKSISFDETSIALIAIAPPDAKILKEEDNHDAGLEKPYRIGICIEANLDPAVNGSWFRLDDGGSLWMLRIRCEGAVALGLDYSRILIPPGGEMFISNPDYSHIIGAFTNINNSNGCSFSTRPVRGEEILVEYYQPPHQFEQPIIEINGINYIYRGFNVGDLRNSAGFGGSGPCEVNVKCEEGSGWQLQARGVVRILARVKGQSFWCTGSVLNNTSFDFSPLILTANHCSESLGNVSSPEDMNKWTFYFNYQSDTCDDPPAEPEELTMVGASKLASSSDPSNIGSDFFLARLKQQIPSAYNAFYNGWDRSNNSFVSGVGIHHPEGDIKKISTYTEPLISGTWQSTPGTHWIVKWSATQNGFGVTERGSSGSAIFSTGGLVIGTLTGGESGCTNTNGADYYGKLSFSWESNGTADSMQLKPWLDPVNDGRMSMEGSFNDKLAVSDFEADTTTIPVGGQLDFFDRSSGNPNSWEWYFEGGEPSSSNDQNPKGIKYASFGKFSVKLSVTNHYGTDTLTKVDYIDVKALVYPNPSNGRITVFTHAEASDNPVTVEIFNVSGTLVQEFRWERIAGAAIQLDLPRDGNFFIVRMTEGDQVQVNKVVVVRVKQD